MRVRKTVVLLAGPRSQMKHSKYSMVNWFIRQAMDGQAVRVFGGGRVEYVPWPEDYINVETGDYVTDIKLIRAATGWAPATGFDAGVELTCAYYRENKSHYW